MSNPLYWEDHVSSTGGAETPMIVDAHHPSFRVTYGVGKYDHVQPDHSNLLGTGRYAPCAACGRERHLTRWGICETCQRTQHTEEQRRQALDQPMGDHKRTPITLDRTR
jgi:hypothetical protein